MFKVESKFAAQNVTIFSVMTEMAQRLSALNLSQGFPDFPAPPDLVEALCKASHDGHHQYAPGDGLLTLREQLAAQFYKRDQINIDPRAQLTITPGATIAIFCAIQAMIRPGDEVIIFDPSYDSYVPSVQMMGGSCKRIALQAPEFKVDWEHLKQQVNSKTRMIVVNTPHNPSATVWTREDWQQLIKLVQDTNIVILSDEVYEHLVFDGRPHLSALSFPELAERSFVIGSFGKTFHVTGWKTGYCAASPHLMRLFRQVYQFVNFCANTPCQVALASYMQQHPEHIEQLGSFYQAKRDLFIEGLKGSRFQYEVSQGTYFQNLDYSQICPELNDMQMCKFLAEQHGIVAIPVSAFYEKPPSELRLIRFCFAKQESTLHKACEILRGC